MATQTYAVLTNEQKTFYDRTLLERLLPKLVFAQYGQKKSFKGREGDTINFRRFNSLPAVTTPLTEGVTPASRALDITALTATVSQFGDYVEISDKLDMVGIDPVLTETSELLGEQAGLSIDTQVRDIVCAGTTVQYANGRATRATVVATDVMTGLEVKKAVRTLRRANVQPLEGGNYIGIIGANVEFDLMADPKWEAVSTYSASEQIFKGEIGRLYGVKFVRAGNTKTVLSGGAPSIPLEVTMIIGKGAYGVVDVEGSSKPEMIFKDFGTAGTADPLNQRATSGWKALFTAVRLNELCMVRIESGATP